MKSLKYYFGVLIFTCIALGSRAQLNITILVNPPYPIHLDEYLNYGNTLIVSITNTGATAKDFYLRGSIEGDNGISLVSDPTKIPSAYLSVGAGQTKMFYGSDMAPFFSLNSTIITGIDKQLLIRNEALPEGNYQVCLEAYDRTTNTLISTFEACAFFFVKYIQPPIITSPACASTVTYTDPQTLIFSWTPAIGAPPTTLYTLKIAECIPPTRPPYDALHAATTPPLFETQVPGYVYVYGPGQPPLEPGKVYAFSVTASDPTGQAVFINNGESEVCSFEYGAPATLPDSLFVQYYNTANEYVFPGQFSVSGKMEYFIFSENPGKFFPLANMPLELRYGDMLIESGTGKKHYKIAYPDNNGMMVSDYGMVLANTVTASDGSFTFHFDMEDSLGLLETNATMYFVEDEELKSATGDLYRVLIVKPSDDHYCIPDYGITAEQVIADSILQIGNLQSRVRDFSLDYTFKASKKEQLLTFNVWGFQSSENAVFDPNTLILLAETMSDNTMTDNVTDFYSGIQNIENNGIVSGGAALSWQDQNYIVSEMADFSSWIDPLEEAEYNVDVYRINNTAHLPPEEGNIGEQTMGIDGRLHIFHGVTSQQSIRIDGLVKNTSPADVYILEVTPVDTSIGKSKLTYQFQFPYEANYTVTPQWTTSDIASFNSGYISPVVPFESISSTLTGSTTIIRGTLQYIFADPGEYEKYPLKNHTVKLVKQYGIDKGYGEIEYIPYKGSADKYMIDNLGTIATATTDDNGNFVFSFSNYTQLGLIAENAEFTVLDRDYYDQYFNDNNQDYGKDEGAYPPHQYSGALYCFVRVMTESEYYTNQDRVIDLHVGEAKQLEQPIICKVRSYSLTATLTGTGEDGEYNPDKLRGMVVNLWRIERPKDVPPNEGTFTSPYRFFQYTIVGQDTTDANGVVTFKRLVKNFGNNDTYFISAYSSNDPSVNPMLHNYSLWIEDFHWNNTPYGSNKPVSPSEAYTPDRAIWSKDYIFANVMVDYEAQPLQPKLTGSVHRSDDVTTPVKDVAISLSITEPYPLHVVSKVSSDDNGWYRISNYPVMYAGSSMLPGDLILSANKPGYNIYLAPDLMPKLKMGQQGMFNFNMTPGAELKGRIVDEAGNPVQAMVTIGDGADLLTGANGEFQGAALSYQNQAIFVDPLDDAYQPASVTKYVNTWGIYNAGDIEVVKIQHHMQFTILEKGTNKPVANADVEIYGTGISGKTDTNGSIAFAFENASVEFQINVSGPGGEEWFNQTVYVENTVSVSYDYYTLYLEPATQVQGHVYANGLPLKDAKVFLDMAGYNTQAFTDANGLYVLHNVPKREALMLKAVKSVSDKVGDSITINTTLVNNQVDFHLTVFSEIDISTLWGFPIEVEHLSIKNGRVQITGSFVNLPANGHFALSANTDKLHFDNIPIKAGSIKNANNIGYAVPDGIDKITFTNHLTAELKLFDTYLVDVGTGSDPVAIAHAGGDFGALKGIAVCKALNFAESTLHFENAEGIYLNAPGETDNAKKMQLTLLTTTGDNPYPVTAYPVSDNSGSDNAYQLFGANLTASPATSSVTAEKVSLDSYIHTAISSISPQDINVHMGAIQLPPGNSGTMPAVDGIKQIVLKMNKWELTSSDWTFDALGLVLNTGHLNAEGLIVPFNAPIYVKYSVLQFATMGTFDLANIQLLGNVQLTITGNNQFGYDGQNWQLSFTSAGLNAAGYITGLAGMDPGTQFTFDQIWLKNNGDKLYQMRSTATDVFGFAEFTTNPGPLGVTSSSITFNGGLDLHIPLLDVQQTSLTYTLSGNTLTGPSVNQFNFTINTNGVIAQFQQPDKQFTGGAFTCTGTVSESGVFSHNVKLVKNAASCSITVLPGQEFSISPTKGSKLKDITGSMTAVSDISWNNYTFTGTVWGLPGASGTFTCEVFADIIVNSGEISISNINTPFGDFSLVYNVDAKELTGTLNYPGQISAGLVSIGPISAQIKIGSKGWYFASVSDVNPLNVPINMTAAMVIGDYPIKSETFITDMFAQHSVLGALPQGFAEAISGFYVNGSIAPLQSLPGISFDFFIASGNLSIQYMSDFSFGINFNTSNIYYLGQGTKFNFKAGAGVSAVIGCVHGGFSTEYLMYYTGEYNTASDAFTLKGDAKFEIGASIGVGFGCCESDCSACFDTPFGDSCNNESISGKAIFSIHAEMNSNGDITADCDIETIEL